MSSFQGCRERRGSDVCACTSCRWCTQMCRQFALAVVYKLHREVSREHVLIVVGVL